MTIGNHIAIWFEGTVSNLPVYKEIDPVTNIPGTQIGKAWKGMILEVIRSYTDPTSKEWWVVLWEGKEAYISKTYMFVGKKYITPGPSYVPADIGYLVPRPNPDLTPYGDAATLQYALITIPAINVRAGAPDPTTGALNPTILGQLTRGCVIEITGGSPGTAEVKWTRITYKTDAGWVKGWIKDTISIPKETDPELWTQTAGYWIASVLHLATMQGTVPPPPPPPPPPVDPPIEVEDISVMDLLIRMDKLWKAHPELH